MSYWFLWTGYSKVCTVLVQRGTLKRGRFLVAGKSWARLRTMSDENGKQLTEVGPGFPAELTGWKEQLPDAGDLLLEADSEVCSAHFWHNWHF